VPEKLGPEERAPDSIQFNMVGMDAGEAAEFARAAEADGVKVQIFGRSADNARAYWNWKFLGAAPDLPRTRAMLMNACDVRLPARLTLADCDAIASVLTAAADAAKSARRAYGT
jgi:hypothetical protein